MLIELVRVGQGIRGTFGVLRYKGVPFVLSLEPPWGENQEDVSCIPAGRYVCKAVRSPTFGITYEVTRVPDRTHILFHKGNYLHNTKGCILLAEEFSGTFDAPTIVSSERGFGEFMALTLGRPEFDLVIFDAPKSLGD